jgi:hypothetical protein
MAKEKDNLIRLMKLATDGKFGELRTEGTRILQETQREIMDLQQQLNFIMYLLTKYCGVTQQQVFMTLPMPISAGKPNPINPTQLGRKERKELVKTTALEVVKTGKMEITGTDVLDALQRKGISLGVARPTSMIGTVLSALKQFNRVEANRFRYIGDKESSTDKEPEKTGVGVTS